MKNYCLTPGYRQHRPDSGFTMILIMVTLLVSSSVLFAAFEALYSCRRQFLITLSRQQEYWILQAAKDRAWSKWLQDPSYAGETWIVEVDGDRRLQVPVEILVTMIQDRNEVGQPVKLRIDSYVQGTWHRGWPWKSRKTWLIQPSLSAACALETVPSAMKPENETP